MTLLGWIAASSLTVSVLLMVWAVLAWLDIYPPSMGVVTWRARRKKRDGDR